MTATTRAPVDAGPDDAHRPDGTGQQTLPRVGAPSFWLSTALVAVAATTGAATFFADGILLGPAVSIGSARGTALVILVVAVPTVIASMIGVARGSTRALACWLGGIAYLLYNAQLLLYGTPLNRLFLLDVALLSLSIWTLLAVLHETDVPAFARRFAPTTPVRPIAAFAFVVAALNALIWLKGAAPAVSGGDPSALMAGTGMTTNPVYIQDLAFWLPTVMLTSVWLWQRRPWGYLAIAGALVLWVLEAVSIAVDQWFSHAADPASSLASSAMVPAFAVVAVVTVVPLVLFLRRVEPAA